MAPRGPCCPLELPSRERGRAMEYAALTFLVEREEHWYSSTCLELGTASFGDDTDEAIKNLSQVTTEYLRALNAVGECRNVLARKGIPIYGDRPAAGDAEPREIEGRTMRTVLLPLEPLVDENLSTLVPKQQA